MTRSGYERYLFAMCGIAGLILGTGGGLVGAALPYINQTSGFTPAQLSKVGAALILAPLAMTALFLFISIPMMEHRQLKNKPGYADYRKRTRILI